MNMMPMWSSLRQRYHFKVSEFCLTPINFCLSIHCGKSCTKMAQVNLSVIQRTSLSDPIRKWLTFKSPTSVPLSLYLKVSLYAKPPRWSLFRTYRVSRGDDGALFTASSGTTGFQLRRLGGKLCPGVASLQDASEWNSTWFLWAAKKPQLWLCEFWVSVNSTPRKIVTLKLSQLWRCWLRVEWPLQGTSMFVW